MQAVPPLEAEGDFRAWDGTRVVRGTEVVGRWVQWASQQLAGGTTVQARALLDRAAFFADEPRGRRR